MTVGQQLSINKNENTNAESNALQSRQTKEFLEKIASPKWLKQKKLHILAKWEEHVMWDIQKKAKWDALIEEQKIKQGKSDSSPKEEEEVRLAVLENHFSKEEVVEREDLQYKMYFDKDKPGELIKKFAKLEEENLALINNQQENEETITEEEAKAKKSLDQKDELIAVATKRKELLTEQEKELTEKVKIMKELCNQKVKASGEISFEKIEDTINMFYKDFKKESEMRAHELGVVNKTEVKNKENILKILKAIERLLIDQLSNLTTQMQDSDKMEKIRRLRNEHGRPNKNKEDKERLLEIERKKAKEKQEKRLQELRRRKGRKDMFKFSFPDKEDEAEDNNKDEDWLIYQKYFMD